jgi:hypothetical protein
VSFDLAADPALARLGAIVHALDVGGAPVAEASGFEAIMAGLRAQHADDDAFLAAAGTVLDACYAAFARPVTAVAGSRRSAAVGG